MVLKVAIIGSGVGGTALAAQLAVSGFDVNVYEKNSFVGGRCSNLQKGEYRFDRGASLMLMLDVYKHAFKKAQIELSDLSLRKCERNYKIFYSDGEVLEWTTDLVQLKEEVERFEGPGTFVRFLSFLSEASLHLQLSIEHVLKKNFTSFWHMVTFGNIKRAFQFHLFNKLYSRTTSFFKSDHLRMALTFQSMYLGMSPYDAPAVYSLLQATEFIDGIYYPIGGMQQIIDILKAKAESHGAKFYLNSGVKEIIVENSIAQGLVLDDGQIVSADIVVSNADAVYTYNNLLKSDSYAKRLLNKQSTCSSISFYWAMSRKMDELSGHTVFLSDQYKDSFEKIIHQNNLADEPSFYIHAPSSLDPSVAPSNRDAITILVPVGTNFHSNSNIDADFVRQTRKQIIDIMERRLKIVNLENLIIEEHVSTPYTWEQDFNLHEGSILGLSGCITQCLWFRPSTTHAKVSNLYFVGSNIHPGTGVPCCLAGSCLTADQIIDSVRPPKAFPNLLEYGYFLNTMMRYFKNYMITLLKKFYVITNSKPYKNS